MRVTLLLAVILTLGLLDPTNALCDLKNGDHAVCQKLEDVKYIESNNLTTLKAPVPEKTLRSTSLKILPPSMKSLDLSEGKIEVVEPGTFLKMNGLVDLKMSDNYIAQLKDSALDGLQKLKNFDLRRNDIRQLPSALTTLRSLKNLEISGNPLSCNCATLRVRNELLSNGVKISKKVFCMTPSHLRGVSLLVPEAEVICMFEEQDDEMQADEAAGSGDAEDDVFENLTEIPAVLVPQVPDETASTPVIINDDLIIPVSGRSGPEVPVEKSAEPTSSSEPPTDTDDFVFLPANGEDDLIVEGSGLLEPAEEGSGGEGSGTDDIWGPINPLDFLDEENEPTVSTTEEPTTASPSWYDVIWSTLTGDDKTTPSGNSEPEKSLTDEEFIPVVPDATTTSSSDILNRGGLPDNVGVTEEEVVTKKVELVDGAVVPDGDANSVTKSDKIIEDFASTNDEENTSIDDMGEASTRQSKKSMGSYVVLAALLGVLAALVGFAAYKSSLCKKKPNDDPERGTELKDVQKALLDTNNSNQPKIASNGNKESVPLVEPTEDGWAGPQEIRQWSDHNTPAVENGTKYTPSGVESDPVKPPRKSLPPQEEPNGFQEVKTHSPLSSFAPRTHGVQPNSITPPNSPSSVNDLRNRSPPLSPNAQRVKITLQENPDSVPKTPILITRTKPGVNLVKSP